VQRAVAGAIADAEVQKRLPELGVEPRSSTPEELAKLYASEAVR
jgi:tripartite-type tricarboxylate transporter receptor subunit TctC